ncbi:hypothetical protein Aros01_07505 [Streptosporangium roseum]
MKIGDLARETGVSVRLLRYYEEQGLLVSERAGGGPPPDAGDAPPHVPPHTTPQPARQATTL